MTIFLSSSGKKRNIKSIFFPGIPLFSAITGFKITDTSSFQKHMFPSKCSFCNKGTLASDAR